MYNVVMEKRLYEYIKFIEKTTEKPGKELVAYHREMVANFQHERLVHLIIMLFFVFISLVLVALTVAASVFFSVELFIWPLMGTTVVVVVMTGFYVRHYYVLENGVQKLYDYSKKLL